MARLYNVKSKNPVLLAGFNMGWNDTLAAYLLAIPIDSLDFVDQNQLLFGINNVTAYYTLNHDKSAENIFSNSIDTWNMQLMDVSEEELKQFIEERDKNQITIGDAPEQEMFRTPVINADSLPDIKDWLK